MKKIYTRKDIELIEKKHQRKIIYVTSLMFIIWGVSIFNTVKVIELYVDYQRAIKIIERIEDSGVTVVKAGSNVEEAEMTAIDLSETSATPSGSGGAKSPSTDWEGTFEVSAYTSRVEETDSTPCISADGTNICEYDGCVVANNDYPLGTKIEVEGFGICEVRDRMNSRYTGTGNLDIYFGYDVAGALEFGRQNVRIKIVG